MKAGSWTITHDPVRVFGENTEARELEDEAREQGEDIIQAVRGRMTLDLGWYRDRYQILLVKDQNWDEPVSRAEANDLGSALKAFRKLLI
jgi:hypothetical protein